MGERREIQEEKLGPFWCSQMSIVKPDPKGSLRGQFSTRDKIEFDWPKMSNVENRPYGRTDLFLQFLYEMNVIGYVVETENKPYFGWCYRERTPSNISPKVKTGVRYETHYAVMKALDLGTKFKKKLI
jgi:hypothetical protein